MPLKIPDGLPALDVLTSENIFVMDESRAKNQDIRPMELAILNLMPNKIETEIQIMRLLSNTPLQVNVDLVRIDKTPPKNTSQEHMEAFYQTFDDIKDRYYDGFIITGAPLGLLEFNDVDYWEKFGHILDWSKAHVQSTLFLCWAAHAALHHFYKLPRHIRDEKLSGVYEHDVLIPRDPLMRGFDDTFFAPHSRYAQMVLTEEALSKDIDVLADSQATNAYLMASKDRRQVFVTGHPEYDRYTLHSEYTRDVEAGITPAVPLNYYHNDDPSQIPMAKWRSHGYLLFSNWLNYYVYQETPYDLTQLAP